MKLAYLSPITDGTGYSHAANNTILALDSVGIDVTPIEVKLAGQSITPPKRILELCKKSNTKFDIAIQHVLPPLFTYKRNIKNIGYAHFETSNFKSSGWQHYINNLQELWVCCEENKASAESSGVKIPIKVIPLPSNLNIYKTNLDSLEEIPTKNYFTFYTISDYSSRKNVQSVITAYLSEFNKSDGVLLVLKCYLEGSNYKKSSQIITNDIKTIKQSLRKHVDHDKYPPILIISEYLDDLTINRLHKSCDCFVSAERGAAWNIPAFDAMGFGNAVIVNGWGGQTQFVKGLHTKQLEYRMTRVMGMNLCPYQGLYTSYEEWADPDFLDLCHSMRAMYNTYNPSDKINISQSRIETILKPFGMEESGQTIKNILC